MQLSIFARLIIGYLVLVSMLVGVSLYFIYHLDQFNQVIRSIIFNDTIIVQYSNQLSDILLSESRNDRKYVVLKDRELYENYLKAGDEFNQLLSEALVKSTSVEIRQFFQTIDIEHKNFMVLVKTERELIEKTKSYPAKWYAEEKKKTAESIIEQLKKVKQVSESTVFKKIVGLAKSGDKAKTFSIIISLFALSIGLIVAFIITTSIKKPMDVMRAKTIEISHGNFKGDLDVKSPPVIAELATAINIMGDKLQEVDDMKAEFFSNMSHELRTPLTSIREGSTMLLEGIGGEVTEKQKHILSIVIQESNRLIEQVNLLLDLSKMEAGMLQYQFTPTDLSVLIKKTLEALAPLADAKNLSIDNKIGTLEHVEVDRERIEQVFRNIIGNALKFTNDNGTITLESQVRENVLEVSICDTGPGIPKSELGRIFNQFHQGSPAKGQRVKGTGLGLAIVKQITFAHGGKVWATSQVGQGSTFYITLPLAT